MGSIIEQKGVREANEVEKRTDSVDHRLIIKVLRDRGETLITSEKKEMGKSHQVIPPSQTIIYYSLNRSSLRQTHYLMRQDKLIFPELKDERESQQTILRKLSITGSSKNAESFLNTESTSECSKAGCCNEAEGLCII